MINKRLIAAVSESRKYVAGSVLFQWASLLANIFLMALVCRLLESLYGRGPEAAGLLRTAGLAAVALACRFACGLGAARMSYLAGRAVKGKLRDMLYRKLLKLGAAYQEKVSTSEAVQVAVEGVEQLEVYFGQYLPQFFYALLAPATLFAVLWPVNVPAAAVLLACVPLIPVSIAAVQTWAKKLLGRYWDRYTALGDTFLENLQGLTTLKIYQADGYKNEEMNRASEEFRRITMKVLTMQLNSITVMDLVAYGGAAAGLILAAAQLRSGGTDLFGALLILLLAADFFLPMRLLGSYFHVAMNGMAAAEKIFRILDAEEPPRRTEPVPGDRTIRLSGVSFAYEPDRAVLRDVTMTFPEGSFTAIVGESGCGKSTVAAILMGRARGYGGTVTVGGTDLAAIREESLMENLTYISHNSYLFKGTVRENLLPAAPGAGEETLWQVLEQVRLADFLRGERGLDTPLEEKGGNLSGGQRQRLALARALLHDSPVYIFDEATSNIDVESETDIMEQILALAGKKTIILISHRLANVVGADRLYVLEGGRVAESGRHGELLAAGGRYAGLWKVQQALEQYGKEAAGA